MKKIIFLISVILLCACTINDDKNKIYEEYINTLMDTREYKACEELTVSFYVKEVDENYLNYYVLINRNNNIMKDIEGILIHDKTSINSFPSIGIYDEKVSLVNESDKQGVKLSGYLEIVESAKFSLLIKYIDKDNNKRECSYVYNYQQKLTN